MTPREIEICKAALVAQQALCLRVRATCEPDECAEMDERVEAMNAGIKHFDELQALEAAHAR